MVEFFPTTRAAVSLGGITVYWYGLLYVAAFGVAYVLIGRWQRYRGLALSRVQLLELITWGAVGVIVGGRLGYVLLYEPLYYLQHPVEIIQLSHGGMSSHGGFVGVAVATWFFSRVLARHAPPPGGAVAPAGGGPPARHPHRVARLLDIIVVPAALGLALGRLGNVINHELYITFLAQVVAVGSPLIIALLCYWHLRHTVRPGKTTGLFLVFYSLARFGEEYVRELDWPLVSHWVTWGQVYTLPLFLLGLYLLKDEASRRHSRQS